MPAAAAGRARWRDGRAATEAMGAWLSRHRRGAWRHRRAALGIAWSICLLGWTGSVLLPDGARSSTAASAAAQVGAAGPAQRPSPAAPKPQRPSSSTTVAELQSDLARALALRTAQVGQLAGIPRLLDGRPNPVHQRRAIQLAQQDALIASLRLQLAGLAAHAADPEWRARPSAPPARLPAGSAPRDGAPPASIAPLKPAGVPWDPLRTAADVARIGALCGVLLLAATVGAALAAWRGRHDGIIDHPSQLRQRLPVLCVIDLPAPPAPRRHEPASGHWAGFAGLLGLFASLILAEGTGALATVRQGLLPGWPG